MAVQEDRLSDELQRALRSILGRDDQGPRGLIAGPASGENVTKPTIAIFCMAETGHFGPVRPLIYDLAGRGFDVRVFTDGRFGSDIERAGAKLVDIFADHPLDSADGESIPFP